MSGVNGYSCAKFFAFFLLVSIFISGCAQPGGSSTDRTTESDIESTFGDGTTGTGFDPADSLDDIADSIADMPAENAAQQAALDGTADVLGDMSGIYGLLMSVDTQAEAQAWAQQLAAAEARLKTQAAALEAAGLTALAAVLRELLAKHDVYRVVNKKTGQHHLFTGLVEGIMLVASGAWNFEGVGLRLYDATANGRAALYRCLVPKSIHHFVSRSSNCEGQINEGILGYASLVKNGSSFLPIIRFFNASSNPDHLITMNPDEANFVRTLKHWKEEGILGYMNW